MDGALAAERFVRDAIFIYTTQLPDVIASVRMMALLPGRLLGIRVLHFPVHGDPDAFLTRHGPSALVFTKAFDDSAVRLATAARRRGIPVVTILCDHHFDDEIGRRNRQLSAVSNAIVVQTAPMAEEVVRHLGKQPVLIEEMIEYPRGAPRFAPERPLKLLWYGHSSNHDTLEGGLRALAGAADVGPVSVMIVTNAMPEFMNGRRPDRLRDFSFDIVPWSPEAQYAGLARCDVVFIPSLDTPAKRVKGHNRLVEAINAGRLAVAFPLPQYRELAAFCACGENYGEVLTAALADRSATTRRIEAGQRYIDGRFSGDAVCAKWRKLLIGLLQPAA
jgi:hypothetical protein